MFKKKIFLPTLLVLLILLGFIFFKNLIFQSKEVFQDSETQTNSPAEISATLPDIFPQDFPVFPGAILIVSEKTQNKIQGISAVWETKENMDVVSSFYLNNLIRFGWGVEVVAEKENYTTLSLFKDQTQGFIGITKGKDDKIIITLALGIK